MIREEMLMMMRFPYVQPGKPASIVSGYQQPAADLHIQHHPVWLMANASVHPRCIADLAACVFGSGFGTLQLSLQ